MPAEAEVGMAVEISASLVVTGELIEDGAYGMVYAGTVVVCLPAYKHTYVQLID